MTPTGLVTSLNNLQDLLVDFEIAILTNRTVSTPGGNSTRVTWKSSGVATPFGREFATIEEYCGFIGSRSYSALMFDGALLQISYDFRHRGVVGHRLCFYPCPFDVDPELLLEGPFLDVIECYRSTGEANLRLRSPIRFDFSVENADDRHPAAHVHMLWSHCRCPIVAPLSPGHFVQFVFKNFYPGLWQRHEFLRRWPQTLGARTITQIEESYLHFSCRRQ